MDKTKVMEEIERKEVETEKSTKRMIRTKRTIDYDS